VLRLREDGPFSVSDGVETVQASRALQPVGCLRAGTWHATPTLPTFADTGRTWADMPDDVDW